MAIFGNFLKQNIFLILILFLAIFLRFYDYQDRWVLNQDQSRDAIISLYSIRNQKIPLLGPYSSAGPYNFGGAYYILVILTTLLFPFTSGPWVAFTLLSIFCVLLFYKIGKNLSNKQLGLTMALIACVSPLLVDNSTDMLNTVAILFAVTLNFYFISLFLKQPKNIYLCLIGFSVGLANNFHFQSLGFGSILISFLLFNFKSLKQLFFNTILIAIGFITSFLPNLIFDILNNFSWTKSVLAYYFGGGVDKFYYPVRWLTDIRDFWPQLWGNIITGFPLFGYILIGIYILTFIKSQKILSIKKFNFMLLLSLLTQVILMRYYKGVRSKEYLITFHAYFIFFTSLSLNYLSKNKVIKLVFIAIITIFALLTCYKVIQQKSQAQEILSLYRQINQPKINFYSLNGSNQVNLPIFYLYYRQNNIDTNNGYKIATCIPNENIVCPDSKFVIANSQNYQIYDISSFTDEQLVDYYHFTPQNIYNWLYINYPNAKTF